MHFEHTKYTSSVLENASHGCFKNGVPVCLALPDTAAVQCRFGTGKGRQGGTGLSKQLPSVCPSTAWRGTELTWDTKTSQMCGWRPGAREGIGESKEKDGHQGGLTIQRLTLQ